MKQIRCINLDWLEVYALEPLSPIQDDNWFRAQGWQVEIRPYGTRSYKQMFTLIDTNGEPFLEIRREPVGMYRNGESCHLDINGCHLRLCNRACYLDNAAELMSLFIQRYNYTFKRIAKVDIALDFEKFDSGDCPQKFLRRYINGLYSKINQSNISAYGADRWDGRKWWSVRWGAEKSPVVTRFYCKSKELAEVKDKPYIRQAWLKCGLIDDVLAMRKLNTKGEWYVPEIWRVEFSVRSSVKNWVTIDDLVTPGLKKRSFRNTLEVYSTRAKILTMFASLQAHYFHFKHYQEGVSKYKAEDKELFRYGRKQRYYKVEKLASSRPKSDIIQRLINLLSEFRAKHFENETQNLSAKLLEALYKLQASRMAVKPWDEKEVTPYLISLVEALKNNEHVDLSHVTCLQERIMEKLIWGVENS